jgi:hypothetical protein
MASARHGVRAERCAISRIESASSAALVPQEVGPDRMISYDMCGPTCLKFVRGF